MSTRVLGTRSPGLAPRASLGPGPCLFRAPEAAGAFCPRCSMAVGNALSLPGPWVSALKVDRASSVYFVGAEIAGYSGRVLIYVSRLTWGGAAVLSLAPRQASFGAGRIRANMQLQIPPQVSDKK